ncbi:XRE family transcriptional regulator [Streptomyces sp. NBC_00258]|uniref:XRE family transcriptional regulator n=1 Tax=Streptomyces sp. NBC_00258 TaxID=2903642 RepID=UPI002E28508D|nr:XRE family transcriptional regulator [Streptomyces sp. NBC_00258]
MRAAEMGEVARWLRRARHLAGLTYAELAREAGMSSSRLHRAANGCRTPLPVVEAFARACGASLDEARALWQQAQSVGTAGSSAAEQVRVEEISTFAQLREAMWALHAAHDRPSLRKLQERAGPGILPRTTLNEALRGKTRLRKDIMLSFVRVLGVGEDAEASWAAAWDRAERNPHAPQRQVVHVVPSPQLLRALSDLPMSGWSCFAALVDNAVAAQASAYGTRPTSPADPLPVSIEFSDGSHPGQETVTISDLGPGMNDKALLEAARLGWSGKASRYPTLGLGFNVATSRLGSHITVRTARPEAADWSVLTIDLGSLVRGAEWRVPVSTEPKVEPSEHGTHITISQLREPWSAAEQLRLGVKLGDIYSYPIRENRLHLTINGRKVGPRLPCIWGDNRSVLRREGPVPARLPINVTVATVHDCAVCGHHSALDAERCAECQSHRLTPLPQRVWGWVGIQRYLHTTDYGIDFYSHGRKILVRDKSLFAWHDDSGDARMEYPIDMPAGMGRIVGEIHCDHVPVAWNKDSFDMDSAQWRAVVHAVRGQGPLGAQQSRRYGYSVNTSPLAILYHGYRRNDPGLKYLVPGDGKMAIHRAAREWAHCFHRGLPEYLNDDIWYAAAASHDSRRRDGAPDVRLR